MDTVRILITGGTIDNLDYTDDANAPKKVRSVIPVLVQQAAVQTLVETEIICFKDGRFVTQENREDLLRRIKDADEQYIVITHGTTTMPETAKYLGPKITSKTVVLTGAMIMPKEKGSDAVSNLKYSITAVQTLDKGVYICMHGKTFPWNNVRKNVEMGRFENEK